MSRPELSIGEALVGLLEAYGVDTIFGIPGVHNIEMYRALPRSSIKHILPRHEQGAGFMADGYARASGKPGVCFTISGPGVTNIITPLGQAWSDSSPVLLIATALDMVASAQGRGRLHEMISQIDAAKSVTSFASRAYTAQDVQDALAASFGRFASTRPRPSYLEIPLDILAHSAGRGWQARTLPSAPCADASLIKEAANKLNRAERPFIILGGGAMECGGAALQIAESLNAVILTTTAGKGAVPSDHPGVAGYCLSQGEVQNALLNSDCIIAVGTELSETDFWNVDFRLTQHLIRIDIDPSALMRPHAADISILSDAAPALADIAAHVVKRKTSAQVPPPPGSDALREGLSKILGVLRETLPRETVVVSDMTQIAYAANEVFPVYEPRSWIHPVGFGTLGFALPAAIGAKFAVPHKPVVAIAGDYGFQYTLNELGTAVEHKLSLPIFVYNNDALGQIRDNMVDAGIQPNAVTLRNPDFQMLAKSYGARCAKPFSLAALALATTEALADEGPTLIEITPAILKG